MDTEPCSVCGNTDMNLVDGYFYCVECGTQDTNVRETVIEHTVLADGTFAHSRIKKYATISKEVQMSSEWRKWHAYNFMLAGLTDELIALGAKESVKMKVLWIWTRYIKVFKKKTEISPVSSLLTEGSTKQNKQSEMIDEHSSEEDDNNNDGKPKKRKRDSFVKDIQMLTKSALIAILYIALNLDKSEIQLSHLLRLVRYNQLSINNCEKFIPKELNIKDIPELYNLRLYNGHYNPDKIRALMMTFYKRLDLGLPLIPDVKTLISNYITEMCLPYEFKNLVFSLMHLIPFEYFEIDRHIKKALVRVPHYEVIAMSYLLLGLKMCFGLDGLYEQKMENIIKEINDTECRLKVYKLNMFADSSDRLFNFKEWCSYLYLRKRLLCKYFLPMAIEYDYEVDDYSFVVYNSRRDKRQIELSDEVTMDILDKIEQINDDPTIPMKEFLPSITPLTTYTDIIIDYVKDPQMRLNLSEDFSKYSIRFAFEDLMITNSCFDKTYLLRGVTEDKKITKSEIVGTLAPKVIRGSNNVMIFVRNCDNKNWLNTKQPSKEHIKFDINSNENNNSHDPNMKNLQNNEEKTILDNDDVANTETIEKIEVDDSKFDVLNETDDIKILNQFPEVAEGSEIYDDNFDIMEEVTKNEEDINMPYQTEQTELNNSEENMFSFLRDCDVASSDSEPEFDEKTFKRDEVIKELVLKACMKYKIAIPREYRNQNKIDKSRDNAKRKLEVLVSDSHESEYKRKREERQKAKEKQQEIENCIAAYYSSLEKDTCMQISNQLRSFFDNFDVDNDQNDVENNQNKENESHISMEVCEEAEIPVDKQEECKSANEIVNDTDDEGDSEVEQSKYDSKFDEDLYETKQLYVNLKPTNPTDLELVNEAAEDPEIANIIEQKIKVMKNANGQKYEKSKPKIRYESDSEDEVPLSVLKEEKSDFFAKREDRTKKYEPLLRNCDVQDFKYWMRHYSVHVLSKNDMMTKRFDRELIENCPSSFNFVIRECASVVGCTAFALYKHLQLLEQMMLAKV